MRMPLWFPTVLTLAAVGVPYLTLAATGTGFQPLVDPTFAQQAYLKASNTDPGDWFGWSVAVSGDTMVVGANREASNATGVNGDQSNNTRNLSGAAYVFVRAGNSWVQQAYLKASNTGGGDQFGEFVAISGDTIVIGAVGEDSSATGVNGNQADNSAESAGAAYVFVRSGSTWTQQAYLKASNTQAFDLFGSSLAISGNTIVVGAYQEDSASTGVNGNESNNGASNAGAAYVFVRTGDTWTQQAYLKASNTGAGDNFANSVAISSNTVVVGAVLEDSFATGINGNQSSESALDSGAAYVFVRAGNTWTQQAYLKASNTTDIYSAFFGESVAIADDTVVVGATGESSSARGVNGNQSDYQASSAGAAYVFVRSGGTWAQQAYLKASNTRTFYVFGNSVALSGNTAVIGSRNEASSATGVNGNQSNVSAVGAGAAYTFIRTGSTWRQVAYLKASNTESTDYFGRSVSVSGGAVVIGAYVEDGSSTGVNGPSNENGLSAGAAYQFWTESIFGNGFQ
jgi:hypothetical protein